MARPSKVGLDFFPIELNELERPELIKLSFKHHTALLQSIYIHLLKNIYGYKGYYIDIKGDKKDTLIWNILGSLRGRNQPNIETVGAIITDLCYSGLFNLELAKSGVITSADIQRNYYRAVVERKAVIVDTNIWLLSLDDMQAVSVKNSILRYFINQPINEESQPINEDNQPINEESQTQTKTNNLSNCLDKTDCQAKAESDRQINTNFKINNLHIDKDLAEDLDNLDHFEVLKNEDISEERKKRFHFSKIILEQYKENAISEDYYSDLESIITYLYCVIEDKMFIKVSEDKILEIAISDVLEAISKYYFPLKIMEIDELIVKINNANNIKNRIMYLITAIYKHTIESFRKSKYNEVFENFRNNKFNYQRKK